MFGVLMLGSVCCSAQRTGQWNVNKNVFFALDAFVNTFFTIEFFMRLLVSYNRRAFLKDVFNLFDFVAILPFYIDFIIAGGVPFLRLARMLRVFKVSKVSGALGPSAQLCSMDELHDFVSCLTLAYVLPPRTSPARGSC